jgi:glycerol-3-phosphate acyltransferase PlsY
VWLAGQITGQPAAEVLAGVAVILGHNHSIFLHFRGGAGVGTSLGALGAIYLPAGIALLVLLLVVVAVTRYASVGSLVVITVMPLLLLALALNGILSMTYLAYGVLAWAIILNSHRPNIRRLLLGTERRLGNHEPPPR